LSATPKDTFISPFGSDITGNGTVDNPYQTLSKAVSLSQDGDTITAMPGGYNADQTIYNNITIRSQQGYDSVYFSHPSLLFQDSATVIGINFAAASSSAISGYGCENNIITIDSCGFLNNQVAVETACQNIFYISNSVFETNEQDIDDQSSTSITISNSVFKNSGGINSYSQLSISNSVFSQVGTSSAINTNQATLTMKNVTFSGCVSVQNGGAITASSSIVDALKCHFTNNSAEGNGGAIWLESGSLLSAMSCMFEDNMATSGGAFACDSTTDDVVQISNTTFVNNTAGGGCTTNLKEF
jgi:hypothetical protein